MVAEHTTPRNLAVGSDSDVAALHVQRRADMQVIRALRDTQLEHGKTLKEHSELLAALVTGQVAQGKALADHSEMSRTLAAGQAAILDHLGITPPEPPQD